MFSLKCVLFPAFGFPLVAAFGLSLVADAQSSIEARPNCLVNSEIGIFDESCHSVLLPGREVHAKIGDVAGFDANHLHPFVIRKI
jgi:hypothetical protein